MCPQDHAIQAICNILHLVKDDLSSPDLESAKAEILDAVMIHSKLPVTAKGGE